ncbi:uncharacterized protein C5L36_0B07710 [Pichia kudriavzevii]|uniref:Protein transport protein SEC31 n=1 Tax=Pichia kudriavzevii TaxID=4909 RepID=A0A2U9R2H4_PICKU|nr:uncharacterized protein C5L36_0B07710 [Pichia kudriavzevii]AWU75522.1 hypothetical protein C5L36_0B07710 [Pichia kudriavzevii]
MVKLFTADESAVTAWSHDPTPLLAAATLAGVVDDTFSSDAHLNIYNPFNKETVFSTDLPAKAHSIDWAREGAMALGLEDSTVQLLNSQSLLHEKPSNVASANITKYTQHTSPVLQVKFNPISGNILATSASRGEIYIWDTVKHTCLSPGQQMSQLGRVASLEWNNSMSHIFGTAGDNVFASIWDLRAKREVLQLSYGNCNLSTLAWHPTVSTKLVTASDTDSQPLILTWDLRNSSAPEKILEGHKRGIHSLDWCHNDENLLLSCGRDDASILWNPVDGTKLATYPNPASHEIKFAPRDPEVFVTASFSKKITVQSIQDTTKPITETIQQTNESDFWNQIATHETQHVKIDKLQAPKWLKRPISANFGYGGKLAIASLNSVKVVDLASKFNLIDDSSRDMISAISTNNFVSLVEKEEGGNDDDWKLLKKVINKEPINDILNVDSVYEETPIDDDDFFAQISSNKSLPNYTPTGTLNLNIDLIDDDFEKRAIPLLLANKVEELLDLCIETNHITEALVLTSNASKELKDKATSAFFSKKAPASSFARLLYSSNKNSISDIVQNADISSWKEIAKTIINFSSANKPSFNVEMKLLGDRLLESDIENSRNLALSCYTVSGSLDKVSSIWLSELDKYYQEFLKNNSTTAFEARFKALGEVVKKIVVFQSIAKTNFDGNFHDLGSIFVEYADSLVNFGHYELAYKLLNLMSDEIPQIKLEKNKISKAFINNSTAKSNKPSISKYASPTLTPASANNTNSGPRKRNPYLVPEASTLPISQTNQQPLQQPFQPFQPAQPIQPPASGINNGSSGARSNPYAPKTAFESITNQSQVPQISAMKKENALPASMRKDMGGWNDLPSHLTPPVKQVSTPPAPHRTVSQQFQVPPPPLSSSIKSSPSQNQAPPPPKKPLNPYAPKSPGIEQATIVPVTHPRVSSISASPMTGTPMPTPPPPLKAKNPYAPAQSQSPAAQTAHVATPPRVAAAASNPYAPPAAAAASNPYAPPAAAAASNPYAPPAAAAASNPYAPPAAAAAASNPYAPSPQSTQQQLNSFPPPPLSFAKSPTPAPPAAAVSTPPPPAYAKPAEISQPTEILLPSTIQSTIPSASVDTIITILSSELESVKPIVPAKFNKHIADAEKRLNILFQHLQSRTLVTEPTVEKLLTLANALQDRDFSAAKSVKDDISNNHSGETGDWMVGLNRLVGIVEATSK